MKSWGLALIVCLTLTVPALAISPAEQRLVDKAKEQLTEYRDEIAKKAVDTDTALQAELTAAKGANINKSLKTPHTRKLSGQDVVYEFKNEGYQAQTVKELEAKLAAAIRKKGIFGHGVPQAKSLPSPVLNPTQLKRGALGHIEYDTPAMRLGEIKAEPIDAESVKLTLNIEKRFDVPDRNKRGEPYIRTDWKPVSQIVLICAGVDPTNTDWKKPVFVVAGKQARDGKSVIKLIQLDSGQEGP